MRCKSLTGWIILTTLPLFCSGCDTGDTEKFEIIPLNDIHTTAIQKGTQHVGFEEGGPFQERMENLQKLGARASNVFLTQAESRNEAIDAGLGFKFRGPETMTLPQKDDKTQFWLVVFFGRGSGGPRKFTITSVERGVAKIRVNYSLPPKGIQRTADSFPYFAFVPLKNLKAGAMILELRESASKEVTLMRRVHLVEKAD